MLRNLVPFKNESKDASCSERAQLRGAEGALDISPDVYHSFAVVGAAGSVAPVAQQALEWICLVSQSGN